MNDMLYHPQKLKADRLGVQPAKRGLYGIPALAVANAPIVKITSKNWIRDDLFL